MLRELRLINTGSYDVTSSHKNIYKISYNNNNNNNNNNNDNKNHNKNKNNNHNHKVLSWRTKVFYSVGHIYNDLCASIWFSYTLLFFQLQFEGKVAGGLLLLGQVADAFATPFIGFESDRNDANHWMCRYGRRKSWHLFGTLLVTISFPFIFNVCINCEESSSTARFVYYAAFIIMFQLGWAAVQVSHVSLITDLTPVSEERTALNAYRQACTVGASICVYTITLLILGVNDGDASITKQDSGIFTLVVYIICGIGLIFSVCFHVFVKEKNLSMKPLSIKPQSNPVYRKRTHSAGSSHFYQEKQMNAKKDANHIENGFNQLEDTCNYNKWSDWIKNLLFYKVGLIYMMSRLFVNLTQVYTPLYLQNTLRLPKKSIAIIPFVTYVSGFFCSLVAKPVSAKIGSKLLLIIGCLFGLCFCIWINFGSSENEGFKSIQIYLISVLFGVGGTSMLIASLSLTTDLIGNKIVRTLRLSVFKKRNDQSSGAFVFGAMSFFDKMINGSVVVILEQFSPGSLDSTQFQSIIYYQQILVYVSGGAVIFTLLGLFSMWRNNDSMIILNDHLDSKTEKF